MSNLFGHYPQPLPTHEQYRNAVTIWLFFIARGWSKNAVAALLGNMQGESGIDPSAWSESPALPDSATNGFGLVQWTPPSKFLNWAYSEGAESPKWWETYDYQPLRIQWEMENNEQWLSTPQYPMTFRQFSISNAAIENLTEAFMRDYERPASYESLGARVIAAKSWYNRLKDIEALDPWLVLAFKRVKVRRKKR